MCCDPSSFLWYGNFILLHLYIIINICRHELKIRSVSAFEHIHTIYIVHTHDTNRLHLIADSVKIYSFIFRRARFWDLFSFYARTEAYTIFIFHLKDIYKVTLELLFLLLLFWANHHSAYNSKHFFFLMNSTISSHISLDHQIKIFFMKTVRIILTLMF